MNLEVLHLDNHLLVLNKPAGAPVQPDATGDIDLLTLARAYIKKRFEKPGNVFMGLVHRLDRPASGVIVLARTSKAAARLGEQFRDRTVGKRYLAVVEGICRGEGERVDYLLKAYPTVRVVSARTPGAQRAELSWRTLAVREGRSLLEIDLSTGRPHQIRVQLAGMGFPIVGDFRYGARSELDGRNLALHSYRLTLRHPTRDENLTFTALPAWGGLFQEEIGRLKGD